MSEPKRYEWTSNMGMIEFSGGAYVTASDYYSMRGSLRKDVAKSGVNARKNIHPLLTEKNEQIAALTAKNEQLYEIVKAVAHIGVDFGYGKFELNDEHISQARKFTIL